MLRLCLELFLPATSALSLPHFSPPPPSPTSLCVNYRVKAKLRPSE